MHWIFVGICIGVGLMLAPWIVAAAIEITIGILIAGAVLGPMIAGGYGVHYVMDASGAPDNYATIAVCIYGAAVYSGAVVFRVRKRRRERAEQLARFATQTKLPASLLDELAQMEAYSYHRRGY